MLKNILAGLGLLALATLTYPVTTHADEKLDWKQVLTEADGQSVYFNAWGGSENINAYLDWAAGEMKARYNIELIHVKLDDTATAVSTVLAEKTAGRMQDGSVDLIWINGENFASMKRQDLLQPKGWAEQLPNYKYVDVDNKKTITTDFTIPVEGQESPWGMAKLVFFYDSVNLKAPDLPKSAKALLSWAEENRGRFTYPRPPDFIGTSFLKQVLIELTKDKPILQKPVNEATFQADVKPLFAYLDQLNPDLWRIGRAFPKNYPAMRQSMSDGELDIIFAFNPAEASSAIDQGELPNTVRSFVFPAGTLANTHFVTIPFNAKARAGALVTANFLLSPEAQARKQDPKYWGDPTVLAMDKLSPEDRKRFEDINLGVATLKPDELGPALDEPHPSWMEHIEAAWLKRYGSAN